MNHYNIRDISFIVALTFLFNSSLIADESSDSATEQKAAIDHMHHQLHDDQAAYKAQEAQALKELNEMTIRDDVRLEDVYAKIDELTTAQNQILRLRYEHLIEMRKILTDEQKIKYDQNVLNRSDIR
jgi:Spy/CpxP family protein refolding chaperone